MYGIYYTLEKHKNKCHKCEKNMSISTTFKDLSLHIHIARYVENVKWECPEVLHPTWFLFWNPAGTARIICGDQEFETVPEYAFLIPGYTVISGFSQKKFSHLYTHFSVGAPFESVKNQIFPLPAEPARHFFENHLNSSALQQQLHWRILILEYLALLPPEAFGGTLQTDRRIRKALDRAEKQNYINIDNEQLARAAGMSVNNFYRCFRKELQISPKRYFLSMRLNRARNMLAAGEEHISEVAQSCGFANRYQFSKAYKRFFGIAPGAFRRHILKDG